MLLVEKDTHSGVCTGECLLSKALLWKRGRRRRFHRHLRESSLRPGGARSVRKIFTAKIAKKDREGREEKPALASAARVCPWATEIGNSTPL
jgi:hypothetical protein